MGRTTCAGIGIAMALLAAGPVWAASMVDVTGALATDSAASGGASMGAASVLRGTKAALQRNLPTFTPPKIDAPVQGAATPHASGRRATSPSAPAVHGSSTGSWKAGSAAGASAGKSGWAAGATSSSATRGAGQCWATAGARGAAGANAWKVGATASR